MTCECPQLVPSRLLSASRAPPGLGDAQPPRSGWCISPEGRRRVLPPFRERSRGQPLYILAGDGTHRNLLPRIKSSLPSLRSTLLW